jgi:hypothetical protein
VVEAWKRGKLLLEEAERAMLREGPPVNTFVRPSRITHINTNDQEAELNVSKTVPPKETIAQENTSPISSQERSSVKTTTQQRKAKESSRMGIPTIFIYLITIYNDEEGSKSSHITLVLITQEEELGQTSTLASDYLI